jgi:sulfoxide reductase heme-binding subunit YedZ
LSSAVLKEADFQKKILWFNGAIPAVLLIIDWSQKNLGANPPEAFIRSTGVVAIIFLALSLAVTPLAQIFKWSWLIKHRRWLGLWSFYYAFLHLLAYAAFDKSFEFNKILIDIQKRPFILLGFVGFLLMIPLAMTSTNDMIKKMGGKRWKSLHKFAYIIAIVTSMHYWMIVKSDLFYPMIVASLFAVLLFYRLYKSFGKKSGKI